MAKPTMEEPAPNGRGRQSRSVQHVAEVDCEQVLLEIYTYLDGELTEEKKSAIGEHLQGCTHCLEIYDFEAELRHVVSSACSHDPLPADLRMRIARTIGIDLT